MNEERLNTASHAIGAVLGVVGLFVLLYFNTNKTTFALFSLVVYGASIIVLYTASTLYHAATTKALKEKYRILDHSSIYVLIAGTYTPVALITLESGNGWLIFWVVWGIALLGIILKLFFTGRFEAISLLLYLAMGWLIVLDYSSLVASVSPFALNLLMLGGAFYTFGIVFYAIHKIPYNHFIWHLFVLAGSISHFFFILTLL
ncbi:MULTISPECIES: PAQR family membrane homeostasis protein TrhA [unclassified Cellulophaga]|uniref:PAQR family membrane homeostasis protein TrhA n=1 Tax=unclassified Cellulophaga TaxID=2634405 RepID=UPI0026E340CE|nr:MULTISPECIES: hemolysin III family protein [unclassified Cellulophaga]MDO6492042.1 hemolysin III family protein [Cellulophaga sp. 2_MG-2023]MDO6495797.1 hemolysin III family protein [Cellulophaga sp. 3_MG-2023]